MEYQQVLDSFDSFWFYAPVTLPPAVVSAAVEDPGEEIATPICQKAQNVEWNRVKVRRRKQLILGERSKIEGEMNLCNGVKEIWECLMFEKRIGIGNWNYKMMKKKIHPFEDCMAMKEHIKSWAYALASTLR